MPRYRTVKSPSDDGAMWAMAGVGAVLVAGFYGVIQLGSWLDHGTWLGASLHPIAVAQEWWAQGKPFGVYHILVSVVIVLLLCGVGLWISDRGARKRKAAEHVDAVAKFMGDGRELTEASVRPEAEKLTAHPSFGLMLGTAVRNGKPLWAGWEDGVTCIMGPRSGKTTAIVVPSAVNAPGVVFTTSNRPDVVALLDGPRSKVGTVWKFDPQEVADEPAKWLWDPLLYVTDEVKARQLAKQWAEAGRPLDSKTDAFFDPEGQEALANLLLAAREGGYSVMQAARWAANPHDEEPIEILHKGGLLGKGGWPMSADSLRGVYQMHAETRDSILGTARQMMRFLSNKGAAAWVSRTGPDDNRPMFDPDAFVRSSGDTMICLSLEGVGSFGPIVASLTVAVNEAAVAYAKTCPGGRLPVPMVMTLDEVANVCRIKDLPDWYSHFGGRGLFVISILQSYAQGEAAWGATGMGKLWGATVLRIVGRGIADEKFAETISKTCGEVDVRRRTRSSSSSRSGGSKSNSESFSKERVVSVGQVMALPKWRFIILPAGAWPVLAKAIPYWERSEEMREAVDASKRAFQAATEIELEAVDA